MDQTMGRPAPHCIEVARRAFAPERLEVIRRIEDDHFWFESRDDLLEQTLARYCPPDGSVLDVGCGSGRWARRLMGWGYKVAGSDIWANAPEAFSANTYATATADALPWETNCFDAVTMLDLLEHVDDSAALQEAFRVLRPGGILLLSVPAFPSLWSARDERAGHRRRYTRESLTHVLGSTGFRVTQLFGYQFLLLPAVWISRRIARQRSTQLAKEEGPPGWLNRLLGAVNRFEVRMGQFVRPPVGSSLIAVARKSGR